MPMASLRRNKQRKARREGVVRIESKWRTIKESNGQTRTTKERNFMRTKKARYLNMELEGFSKKELSIEKSIHNLKTSRSWRTKTIQENRGIQIYPLI